MKLTTVGTGTAAPHASRVSAAHLVETTETRILFDCGSGSVHRMASLGIAWQAITHVALTHFHTDHISDLPLLLMGWQWGQLPPRSSPITLIGPPGTASLLERMAALHGPWLLAPPSYQVLVTELEPGPATVLSLPGGIKLESHAVPHTPESVAYSITEGNQRLVYTGDTGESEALAAWAQDCDLLLSECSLPEEMAISGHLTPLRAGVLAQEARAKRLVLTHLYPPVEAVDISALVGEHYVGPMVVAADGWSTQF